MTAPDPRLGEIEARYRDCLSYNFGMRNADKLAHEDVPYLLAELRARDESLSGVADDASIEAAARAICAAEFPECSPSYAWGVQFEDGQAYYRALARAAVAAATGGGQ